MSLEIETGVPIPHTRRGIYDTVLAEMQPGHSVVVECGSSFAEAAKRWGMKTHTHRLTEKDRAMGHCQPEQVGKFRVWVTDRPDVQNEEPESDEPKEPVNDDMVTEYDFATGEG